MHTLGHSGYVEVTKNKNDYIETLLLEYSKSVRSFLWILLARSSQTTFLTAVKALTTLHLSSFTNPLH